MSMIPAGSVGFDMVLSLQRLRADIAEADRIIMEAKSKWSQPIPMGVSAGGGGGGGTGSFSSTVSGLPFGGGGASNIVETAARGVETINRVINETINKTLNEVTNKISNRIRSGGLDASAGNINSFGNPGNFVSFGNTQGSLNMEQSLRQSEAERVAKDRDSFLHRLNATGTTGGFGLVDDMAANRDIARDRMLGRLNATGTMGGLTDLNAEVRENQRESFRQRLANTGGSGALGPDEEMRRGVDDEINEASAADAQRRFNERGGAGGVVGGGRGGRMDRNISNLHNIFIASVIARSVAGGLNLATGGMNYLHGKVANASDPAGALANMEEFRNTVSGIPIVGGLGVAMRDFYDTATTGTSFEVEKRRMAMSVQGESVRDTILTQGSSARASLYGAQHPTDAYANQIEMRHLTQQSRLMEARSPYQMQVHLLEQERDMEISRTKEKDQVAVYNSYGGLIARANSQVTGAAATLKATDALQDADDRRKAGLVSAGISAEFLAGGYSLTGNDRAAGLAGLRNQNAADYSNASTADKPRQQDLNKRREELYERDTRLMQQDIEMSSKMIEVKGNNAQLMATGNSLQAHLNESTQEQANLLRMINNPDNANNPNRTQWIAQYKASGQDIAATQLALKLDAASVRAQYGSARGRARAGAALLQGDRSGAATAGMIGDIESDNNSFALKLSEEANPTKRSYMVDNQIAEMQARLYAVQNIHARGYGQGGTVTELLAAQKQGYIHGSGDPDTAKVIQVLTNILTFLQGKAGSAGSPLIDGWLP